MVNRLLFTSTFCAVFTLCVFAGDETWTLPKKIDNVNFENAQKACESMKCRLPSVVELYSYAQNPQQNAQKSLYWSAQTSAASSKEAFYVSLDSLELSTMTKGENLYYVCACFLPKPEKKERFVKKGALILDTQTGLLWETKTSPQQKRARYNQRAAAGYCDQLAIDGQKGFRLPSASELVGLINFGKKEPAIHEPFATDTQQRYYWSSDTDEFSDMALAVGFRYGSVAKSAKTNESFVRCVKP